MNLARFFHIHPKASDDDLKNATLICFIEVNGAAYSITAKQLAKILKEEL